MSVKDGTTETEPNDETLTGPRPDPASSSATGTRTLPMLPTPNGVVFPEMVVTIVLETEDARAAVAHASDDHVVLVPKTGERFTAIGTIGKIEDRGLLPNGLPVLTVRATVRAKLGAGVVGTGSSLWVEAEPLDPPITDGVVELAKEYYALATRLIDLVGARRFGLTLPDVITPSALADTIAYWPDLTPAQRIELLETVDLEDRLQLVIGWATDIVAELEVGTQIRDDVQESMESDQREAILRRQLNAIQEELGGGAADAISDYRTKLEALEAPGTVAEKVIDDIRTEIDRLERTGDQGQESSWIRTWLDSVFEIPWNERSVDNHDLPAARTILDTDHTGLDEVKDRIVEHLAIRKLQADRGVELDVRDRRGSAILALVGPPGVGKTSLGESIANALGRNFVRMALGGIRDEAEIRGHRRTYVGARPGRLVRALVEAGSMNPVILLDEIDKVGSDYRGDPSAALLEVLDPAQNHSFRDHYLEFELDLSDVIFIATANQLQTIPGPLLDRVEIITIDGYTDDEKATIAADHILPRILRRVGIEGSEIVLDDGVVERVASDWTREAGVRSLERKLDRLVRKTVTKVGVEDGRFPVTISDDDLNDLLGKPIPREEIAHRTSAPGVATGLAVTGAGGDVLFVETTAMEGEPGLTLTGQLGDVMKESGEIARSYLRSHADELGITDLDRRFHVHFPAGAVPKDGPSAGIAMTTALVSLLTDRTVRPEVAMTGEITLQGKVLPIGGVKQKLLAAHRAGLTEVIIPARNGVDLDDVPDQVREELTVHLCDDISEVLELALTPAA